MKSNWFTKNSLINFHFLYKNYKIIKYKIRYEFLKNYKIIKYEIKYEFYKNHQIIKYKTHTNYKMIK